MNLFIESRGLATFWCYCYLFYNVPTINKIFLLLLLLSVICLREAVVSKCGIQSVWHQWPFY